MRETHPQRAAHVKRCGVVDGDFQPLNDVVANYISESHEVARKDGFELLTQSLFRGRMMQQGATKKQSRKLWEAGLDRLGTPYPWIWDDEQWKLQFPLATQVGFKHAVASEKKTSPVKQIGAELVMDTVGGREVDGALHILNGDLVNRMAPPPPPLKKMWSRGKGNIEHILRGR